MPAYIIKEMVNTFLKIVPEGSTVLELGTGSGTVYLAEKYNVISVENQPKWHKGKSELLYVPLVYMAPDSMWYDPKLLENLLKGKHYDAILIDGPKNGKNRIHMTTYYNRFFDITVPVLIDDVWRWHDWSVALTIAKIKNINKIEVRRNVFRSNNKNYEKIYTILGDKNEKK